MITVAPPSGAPTTEAAAARLVSEGYALLDPQALQALCEPAPDAFARLARSWDNLPPDRHLRDGGAYRYRRHASYVLELAPEHLSAAPPRAHWQPTEYNALHGGIERWFDPVEPEVCAAPTWQTLITTLGRLFAIAGARAANVARWYVEAHQFRIDTANGIGRPTPEGAHRDGVDYVAVILIARTAVRGGETRVFQAAGMHGIRFTMTDPWSALLLDDAQVIHETTPIQPAGANGWRDTLVLTYRRDGFQAPGAV